MFNSNGMGIDIGALLGNALAGNRNGENGGWGNNGWWIVIVLLALFGWGGDGNGMFGNRGSGSSTTSSVVDAAVQRGFDTQTIVSKLDGINNGICSLGYDQLAQLNNVLSVMQQCCCNTQNIIQQTGWNLGDRISQGFSAVERGQATAEYNRASDTCAITTALERVADRIIQNDNCNYRSLHDESVALQMQQKDQQIQELSQRLTMCDVGNMINANGQYVVRTLTPPAAQPAYIVPNPNANYYYPIYPYAANNGCCNNNNNCCGNCYWNGQF